ncbi:MAG: hypothetical protein M1817_005581 [Caeruleum heppii]|nr:MAG: hypothetical protein M1817_005581 [Caeruleum heppii]
MSVGQLASNHALSQSSGRSRAGTDASQSHVPLPDLGKMFEPCATTASMFLYAQGSSILCLHHDTLAVDRRFQRHTEEIIFIAVDNVSERGAGRLVVSYDAGYTAIVWDLFTGDEVARFVSYDRLCVAAWMRRGNVAFGNLLGNVILFEPATSEHISARTIFDPITAIAPSPDCRTYAIGYNNGSILIAALQPTFTILHTLTTSRNPSRIVTLAWHGSSSKQKSDMLATQTQDGDLRVWSIAKHPFNDAPKVVRVLKRSETYESGPNWLAWSKNGRIVQFSEGETLAWDVRTKHVTYESVPTLDVVNGLAIHGPTATLFTLGRNHTVQQFDLDPPTLVANKQHPPPIPPPSPPVSVEEQKEQARMNSAAARNADAQPVTAIQPISESEEESLSPLQRITKEMDRIEERRHDRSGAMSPGSSNGRSRTASISSKSSASSRNHQSKRSTSSQITSIDGTMFSNTSSVRSGDMLSPGPWASSSSVSSRRSQPRHSSRLRQEVLRSPETKSRADLFPYTRGRLSDVPYMNPQKQDESRLTAVDLRQQMLSVVFGWTDDIEALIKEELDRHEPGSASANMLSKWLGDIDIDMMNSMVKSETMTASDWMLLCMSNLGGQSSTKQLGQTFVRRLLDQGEVHAAATILLGLGNQHDAVEIYVSHRLFMEAVLLTCLVFPNDWQRLSGLVRKWGEHAVQHSEQHLAIRCFSCTGAETTGVLTSPRTFDLQDTGPSIQSMPQILSPPLSPPSVRSARMTTKNSSLKLITSFGDKDGAAPNTKSRFFGLGDDARTPMNGAGVTPIAESAISPGGATPYLRAGSRRNNNPDSARTATPGGFSRRRLPSIGETPTDATPRAALKNIGLPTPADSGSDQERGQRPPSQTHHRTLSNSDIDQGPLTLSSARYDPVKEASSPRSQVSNGFLPSPARDAFTLHAKDARLRNGSRDRKPDGLQIHWPPMESIITGDYMSPGTASSNGLRTGTSSTHASAYSAGLSTGNSMASARSPLQTGRSMDQYISSLEEANWHAKTYRNEEQRPGSRDPLQGRRLAQDDGSRGRSQSAHRSGRGSSKDQHGRRYIKPAKRSPSSPVPMSPDDLLYPRDESHDDERYYGVTSPVTEGERHKSRKRTDSYSSRTGRKTSPDGRITSRASSRVGRSRAASRQQSPAGLSARGRGASRAGGSIARSPSSPLPMSPQTRHYQEDDNTELKAVEDDRKRFRSRQRSASRRPHERGVSNRREESLDRGSRRDRSTSRRPQLTSRNLHERDHSPASQSSRHNASSTGRHRRTSSHTAKKELAARELEERRQSLARRPSAPAIPHPGELLPGRSPLTARSHSDFPESPPSSQRLGVGEWADSVPSRSKTTSPDGSHVSMGLPATPRAMRHPRYMGNEQVEIPAVPEIPDSIQQQNQMPPPLPSSVYSAPMRGPPRSMSAPIPEEPASPPPLPAALPTHPAFQHALPPSTRRRGTPSNGETTRGGNMRRVTPGEAQPGTLGYEPRTVPLYSGAPPPVMVSIDETIEASNQPINPDNDGLIPPPPPDPPILPELQHLAMPPPPPPVPSGPRMGHSHNNSTGTLTSGRSSGVIDIGIEGASRGVTPVIDVPPPSRSAQGHVRGRSTADPTMRGRSTADTFTSKVNRVTMRMRSKSGSRTRGERNKSPPMPDVYRQASPYESVPPLKPMTLDVPIRSQTTSPHMERHPRLVRAGMTPEMIKSGFMDGGMI